MKDFLNTGKTSFHKAGGAFTELAPAVVSKDVKRTETEMLRDTLHKLREAVAKGDKDHSYVGQDLSKEAPVRTVADVLSIMHKYIHAGGGGGGGGSSTSIVDNLDGTYTITINGVDTIIDTVTPGDGIGTDDQIASEVPYDNTTSGLTAVQVQAAIDELDAAIDALIAAGGAPDQNVYPTVTGTSGTTTANTTTDSLAIVGSTADITTAVTDDTVTIDASPLRSSITTNAGNISTNTTNIATNTSNISTNTTNIAANTAELAALSEEAIRTQVDAALALTANGTTVITYDTTNHLVGDITLAAGNSDILIAEAGRYHVSAALLLSTPAVGVISDVTFEIQRQVNSAGTWVSVAQDRYTTSIIASSEITLQCSTDWEAAVNDRFRAQITYTSTLAAVLSNVFPVNAEPVNSLSVHKVGSSQSVGGGGATASNLPAGTNILNRSVGIGIATGFAETSGRVRLQVMEVENEITIDRFRTRAMNADVTTLQIGLYNILGNGLPGTLVTGSTGLFTGPGAAGSVDATLAAPITLAPGYYFMVTHAPAGSSFQYIRTNGSMVNAREQGLMTSDLVDLMDTSETGSYYIDEVNLIAGSFSVGDDLTGETVNDAGTWVAHAAWPLFGVVVS